MKLIHYSNEYLSAVHDTEQEPAHIPASKPIGLWVSVEGADDWREWCEAESFRLDRLTHSTEVILHDDANVLRVVGYTALRLFHNKYRCDPKDGEPEFLASMGIRWNDVASEYDGIIIAPYIWSLRIDGDVLWYHSWDCASGCIRRARAVKELRPIIRELGEVACIEECRAPGTGGTG